MGQDKNDEDNAEKSGEVGVGLFKTKEEYDNINAEIDKDNNGFYGESPHGKCVDDYAD